MKNYKQILEAINRGIQLALDDYEEDGEMMPSSKSNIVKNSNIINNLVELHNLTVDFNLPSGTLWYKYNIGVDPKKLEISEDWVGNHYAWGELKEKETYTLNNYKFYNDFEDFQEYTKYTGSDEISQLYKDRLFKLELEDDVASISLKNLNPNFHIPTANQFGELRNYINSTFIYNYNGILGLNGMLFKQDDNELFFPSNTFYTTNEMGNPLGGGYWTSSLMSANSACEKAFTFKFFRNEIYISPELRYKGLGIRPVITIKRD